MATQAYSSIPECIKELKDEKFKKSLKNYLIELCPY